MVTASAPGKLIIAGEYGVLDGATAIVAAVPARAEATVTRSDTATSSFTHPVTGKSVRFTTGAEDALTWLDPDPGEWGAVLAAVLATESRFTAPTALAVTIDTAAFYVPAEPRWQKRGFGSSAAATVALCRAFVGALELEYSLEDFAQLCRAAHAQLQAGRGSGVDVLAAIHGGFIAAATEAGSCRPLASPDGLHIVPVWTGVPASSTALIGRFDDYRRASSEYAGHARRLRDCAATAVDAWIAGDASAIVAELAGYDRALRELDRDAAIGIHTDVHELLRGIAVGTGACYKVSGAGGGDFGLAFTASARAAAAVAREFTAAGFDVMEAVLGAPGVAVAFE